MFVAIRALLLALTAPVGSFFRNRGHQVRFFDWDTQVRPQFHQMPRACNRNIKAKGSDNTMANARSFGFE
jgi:hypothetical protein